MSAAEQLPLYSGIREPTVPTRASELDEQARDWLERNPDAWREHGIVVPAKGWA